MEGCARRHARNSQATRPRIDFDPLGVRDPSLHRPRIARIDEGFGRSDPGGVGGARLHAGAGGWSQRCDRSLGRARLRGWRPHSIDPLLRGKRHRHGEHHRAGGDQRQLRFHPQHEHHLAADRGGGQQNGSQDQARVRPGERSLRCGCRDQPREPSRASALPDRLRLPATGRIDLPHGPRDASRTAARGTRLERGRGELGGPDDHRAQGLLRSRHRTD